MFTNHSDIQKTPVTAKAGNILLVIGRILLGCVFVFSGFVKAIDPIGFTYKFTEYFHAMGGIFESFTSLAFPLAVILPSIELAIGLCFILKIHIRLTAVIALLFMLVMTPLTLWIALKNPVSDCGCFGDALVISNWATFYKNIVLLALVLCTIIFQGKIHSYFTPATQNTSGVIFLFIGAVLSVYCYRNLPLIDFLPYKVGVNIPAAMIVPDNASTDKYETTFIYAKNGQQKEFTLENYPKGDSTWKFVDQKTVLVSQGYKAPIHDFSIVNADFEDITEKVLYDTGYTYLLIMYDLNQASETGAKEAEKLYQQSLKVGAKFYALTASSDEEVEAFKQKTGVTYSFCKTDPTALKTIIRANPGLLLIKNGTITGKWNWRDFE
jgi:uncharacterized membrane protein YphA (DoxX/SURF4 family)